MPKLSHLDPELYGALRSRARALVSGERSERTLQGTALLHEAWLRLAGRRWTSEEHLRHATERSMRRILIDRARSRAASPSRTPSALENALEPASDASEDAPTARLRAALHELRRLDPRAHTVVRFRFFGGLEVEEIAELLGVSARTVKRDWRAARLWLYERVSTEGLPGEAGR